jgi:orsellinic acid C2-O-methyltransferase
VARGDRHQPAPVELDWAYVMQAVDHDTMARVPDLIALINGGAMAKAICVAAELKVADHLAERPKRPDELAQAIGSHAPSLRRLLRALVSLDLCHERDDGAFELSAMGALLRSDAQHSMHSWVLWYGTYSGPVWDNLRYSVNSGESARKALTGSDDFAHLDRDKGAAAVFNRAMAEMTNLMASDVLRAYDFTTAQRIVDVGGGHGALLAAVLQANPAAQGALFDQAHAIAGAKGLLTDAGVVDRCELVTGDFFEAVPPGAAAYLLKAVLHDWDDAKSTVILRNCRRAIAPNGRLLIIERVLPSRFEACPRHHAIARADLTMLVALGGRERTEAEFADLLGSSGFKLASVTPTGLEYSLLEGVPC